MIIPMNAKAKGGAATIPSATPQDIADHTICIGRGLVELGTNTIVSTKLYNGQFPGRLLCMQEGKRIIIDIQ